MASKRKSNVSVEHVILSFHHDIKSGPDFVCTCCQAKANGLQLCNVPPELSDLNALELRLISLSILVNTQVQSHALLRRGFGTTVPFIDEGKCVGHCACERQEQRVLLDR